MIHRLKEEIRSEYDAMLVKINRKLNQHSPYQPIQPFTTTTMEISSLPIVTMDKETILQLNLMSKQSEFLKKEIVETIMKEIFQKYQVINVDTSDLLLQAFNFYYWLLLRDYHPNLTGIRNNHKEMKENFILPLLNKIEMEIQKMKEDEITEEEIQKYLKEDSSDDEITEEEIQKYMKEEEMKPELLNFWILQDLLNNLLKI
jgi:hypothetical protein